MFLRKQVAVLRFNGPRFEDHGLDVDVLPEIIAYKKLLQETAKEIWRRQNPDRIRLPKNFDADINLKFFSLEKGSTAVPLMREQRLGQLALFEHELDTAAALLEEAIQAAGKQESAPTHLPRGIIPLFDELGRTLREDEVLLVSAGTRTEEARYDPTVKAQILAWAASLYPDTVDLVGEVRATDLDGAKFTLRLSDGRKATGHFKPEHEAAILEALGEHFSRRVRIKGTGEFAPEDGTLKQIVNVEWVEVVGAELGLEEGTRIWDRLALISENTPDQAWNDIPSDLAENVDRYLYGRKDRH
jgi:hypothetical protein